jgi:RimJ/RimL family protein N-acetyltransferase
MKLPVETDRPAILLDQLYLLSAHKGTGIACELMDWTLAEAARRSAQELYLTVFTENHRARRFYARYGFEEVGPYTYMVGNHADDDIIMRLAL